MYDDLEQTLSRELDDVASHLVVPGRPMLPATTTSRSRWRTTAPSLAAAAAVAAALAAVITFLTWNGPERPQPAPSPTPSADTGPVSSGLPTDPVVVDLDLYVGGEKVPGRWYTARGKGTHWIGRRSDNTWWWGFDARPQAIEGVMDQPPAMSASGAYSAHVRSQGGGAMLVGADTEEGGEGFGGVDLRGVAMDPPPRAVAVTDDGLVVAGGADFQWLWRPLVDAETVDLSKTSPGQVVIGSTGAGLIVNDGAYGATDGTQGEPYLARLSQEGILTRLGAVPTHDVLEANEKWLAYVPPGTVGGEASATAELQVQRREGSGSGVLTPPDGWRFVAPGFRWESSDRLLALVVTGDGQYEGLVRCRPDPASCVLVDVPE